MKKFKENKFYSFDDGYGNRAIGWKIDGQWRFVYDDFTEDDFHAGSGFVNIASLTLTNGDDSNDSILWTLNPKKVK